MPLDHAGAALIGTGLCYLFVRVVVACSKRQAIQATLRQHHRPREPAWRSAATAARSVWDSVPARLRIGLSLGALSTAVGLAPAALRRAGLPTWAFEGTVARALWLAAKWSVVGGVLRWVRAWGVGTFRARLRARSAVD